MKNSVILLFFASLFLYACSGDSITKNCCQELPISLNENNVLVGMPNFFSPNGDGLHDTYGPLGGGILTYDLEIVDTDETVFSSSINASNGLEGGYWDGRVGGEIKEGIFGYRLSVRTVNEDTLMFNGIFCSLPDPLGSCIDDPDQCITESMFTFSGFDFTLPSLEIFCE